MRNLENAVVVVTGASRGIGRAIAEELGKGGAKVVVNYLHHKDLAEEVVEGLLKNGAAAAVAMQADVSHADQAARLIDDTIKQFDRIDVLVNNAGINVDRALKAMSVEDWDRVVQADLNSYFYTVKAALPYFMQVLLAHARAEFGIVQQQICQLGALLHQVQSGHSYSFTFELFQRYAQHLAEHVSGIIEAQGLVEVTGENIFFKESVCHE